MQRILGYLKDERGIETLEWIAIGALILGVAFVVYPGTLQGALVNVVNAVGTALQCAVPAPASTAQPAHGSLAAPEARQEPPERARRPARDDSNQGARILWVAETPAWNFHVRVHRCTPHAAVHLPRWHRAGTRLADRQRSD